jgi:hypothetical protein
MVSEFQISRMNWRQVLAKHKNSIVFHPIAAVTNENLKTELPIYIWEQLGKTLIGKH